MGERDYSKPGRVANFHRDSYSVVFSSPDLTFLVYTTQNLVSKIPTSFAKVGRALLICSLLTVTLQMLLCRQGVFWEEELPSMEGTWSSHPGRLPDSQFVCFDSGCTGILVI
jgi:hypothetical protein